MELIAIVKLAMKAFKLTKSTEIPTIMEIAKPKENTFNLSLIHI